MQNKGYTPEFLDRVRNASNIVDIARNYLPLRQKGQDFWACCPFHSEKTPSFAISAPKQFYYCYGCHESGNVFKFVMKMENLSWPEAVAMLAKRANIEIPQTEDNSAWLRARQKRERLHQALMLARDFYCRNLYLSKNKSALDYLHQRGISDELIKMFHIGYSDSWQGVIDELKQHGISEEIMREAGIAATRENGGRVWDAQFERITFSIHDVYGNCIGFTGRTMKKDDNIAKYKNTSETMVFNKSNIVYGVDVMKDLTRGKHTNGLIVVEGNVDEIAMIKHGFVNTVACMGTALTKFHAGVIKRFSQLVYLCLDGDNAGQNATLKSIDTLQDAGLTVKVIILPKGEDPDDFLNKHGAAEMQKMIDNSVGGIEFKLNYIKNHNNLNDKVGKTEYLNQVVDLLSEITSPAERELYIKDVADSLGVDKEVIRTTIDMKITKKSKTTDINNGNTIYSGNIKHNNHKNEVKNLNNRDAERVVIKGILHNQPFAEIKNDKIVFTNKIYQKIYEQNLKLNEIDDKLEENELQEIAPLRVIDNTSLTPQEQATEWKDCYITLQIAYLKQERQKVKDDITQVNSIIMKIKKLEAEKKSVKQILEEK
ncbi:MAG: DNA primase [Clostridia bacterium]|nr:DNA primase [Clostridia bacterium]